MFLTRKLCRVTAMHATPLSNGHRYINTSVLCGANASSVSPHLPTECSHANTTYDGVLNLQVKNLSLPWEEVTLDQAVAQFESAMRAHRAQRAQPLGNFGGNPISPLNSPTVTADPQHLTIGNFDTVTKTSVKHACVPTSPVTVAHVTVSAGSPPRGVVSPVTTAAEKTSTDRTVTDVAVTVEQEEAAELSLLAAGTLDRSHDACLKNCGF